jgi:flagellar biosynthesis/type III secretory pathway ATPase
MDRESISRRLHRCPRESTLTYLRSGRASAFRRQWRRQSTLLGIVGSRHEATVVVLGSLVNAAAKSRSFSRTRSRPHAGASARVVVVSTSDSPRWHAAERVCATAIAESFRDTGKNVLLMMDSGHALRDGAHARSGWRQGSPDAKGYPRRCLPARLLERAGSLRISRQYHGLLTTVLVEGDDHNEPVADAVRAILAPHRVVKGLAAKTTIRRSTHSAEREPHDARRDDAGTRTKAAQVRGVAGDDS